MLNSHTFKTTYLIAPLLLMLSACTPTFEQDLTALCTMSGQTNAANPEAKVTLIAQVAAEFSPKSKHGKALKAHLATQPPEQMYTQAQAKVSSLDEKFDDWSCPAMERLEQEAVSAKKEAEKQAKQASCVAMEPALDEIAFVLVPMFHGEIDQIITDALPQDKQEDAKRIFAQEYAVKVKLAETQPDEVLETTKTTIRQLAGCGDESAPADACTQLEALIPRLTNNRRVVIIGEAYGEALIQLGLDPSKFSKPLQDRLIELARTKLIEKLKPGIARLSELTQCTFK